MITTENPVRSSTFNVVKEASHVSIDRLAIKRFAEEMSGKSPPIPIWPKEMHLDAHDEQSMLDYFIILDTLNFCFWAGKESERWKIVYRGTQYDGYFALSLSLKKFFEEEPQKANLRYLSKMPFEEFLELILRGGKNLRYTKERWQYAREVSAYITYQYGNSRSFFRSGNGLLSALIPKIANELPSFNDTALYGGNKVYLWKRPQILAIDVYGALGGKGSGAFKDLDYTTAFPDYKIPQILEHFGILRYSATLRERIKRNILIAAGSKEEVEIRSATVWAVEFLKDALLLRGQKFQSFEIDWLLWNASQEISLRLPYHRTPTTFY